MNESILIQKMIQIGVNLNSDKIEYSGAVSDAKQLLDEIKQQCNIDGVVQITCCNNPDIITEVYTFMGNNGCDEVARHNKCASCGAIESI